MTRAKEHPLKLEFVCQLVSNIGNLTEVKFLDVVVIVTPDKLPTFQSKVNGDGQLNVVTDFKTNKSWDYLFLYSLSHECTLLIIKHF